MVIEPIVKELLEAGVHFGHQTRRWNPKMKRYIFGAKNGIYILDLEKTARGLSLAREFLRSLGAKGGPILFVGTKRQAQSIIAEEAVRCGQYYVNLRWLGGLLTNFTTVKRSIERLKTIERWIEDGTMEKMTKKEGSMAHKELDKLNKNLRGIANMPALPKAIFLVDAKREETAIAEARRLGIPVVALVDTNSDPDRVDYVIPGNDDAIRSIKLVTSLLADSILEGYQTYLAGLAEQAAKVAEERAKEEERVQAEVRERQEREEKIVADRARAASQKLAAAQPESAEASLAETALVDDVEAIIPDAALKTKVEIDEFRRKKALPKVKPVKEPEKETRAGE